MRRARRRIALVVVAAVVFAGGAAVAVGRWGCPSQAELQRPRSPREVADAFGAVGIRLVRAELPLLVARGGPDYRRADALRYRDKRAVLLVVVCERRCTDAPSGLAHDAALGPRSLRVRHVAVLGNNLATFFADGDGRSARRLLSRAQPALNRLDAAVAPDSRCYDE